MRSFFTEASFRLQFLLLLRLKLAHQLPLSPLVMDRNIFHLLQ